MQETQVRSLGGEDPLEEGRATHSCILVRRIPCTEEPGGLQSMGSKELNRTEQARSQWLVGHILVCVSLIRLVFLQLFLAGREGGVGNERECL